MFKMVNNSLKFKKALIEDNEYMICCNWIEQDEFKNKILTRENGDKRFCKATKKGNITINFYGQKIKENISNILDMY